MIHAICAALIHYVALVSLQDNKASDSKLIAGIEDYYGSLTESTKLSSRVKLYADSANGITNGKLKGFYKKGQLVLITNFYNDGNDCTETVAYALRDGQLLLVDDYRQCSFKMAGAPKQEYRQTKDYFSKNRLSLVIHREGEGKDDAEQIQFTGQQIQDGDEQILRAQFDFWKGLLSSELNFNQFRRVHPIDF